ncbi:MAG: aspartate/glutamate racemase family protein [Clostridia bacterium]|nr:aspartate/glutamate racemase family protein [Clostridia bacterium]
MRFQTIGVFDSGVGGLTVLARLLNEFNGVKFLYLGDNGNVPYGSRPKEEIRDLARKNLRTLAERGAGAAVVACNTASLCLQVDEEIEGMRIIKLIPFIPSGYEKKRGVFFGTPATVAEVREKRLFSDFEKLEFCPLPSLAAEVERQLGGGGICKNLDHFLPPPEKVDFLYLGCTHFIYLKEFFSARFGAEKCFDGTDKIIENCSNYIEKSGFDLWKNNSVEFIGKWAEENEKIFRVNFPQQCRI